jgi:PRTRC genetic system ThiF family protein
MEKQDFLDGGLSTIKTLEGFKSPIRISILGCGGTGAYVVGHLSRLISVLPRNEYQTFNLTLIDGDKVEQKNLERQHFIHKDLGLNKAEVLATRYAAAFGIQIKVIPSYLEKPLALTEHNPDLLISCVDNNASRRVIDKWFLSQHCGDRGRFWIDAGNEESSGQVICGYMPPSYIYYSIKPNSIFSMPIVTEVYGNILESKKDKFNSELSCAELAAVAPQNMMTNITAATIVLNFAQNILREKPLRAHGVTFSVENSFRTLLNTPENLAKVNHGRRRPYEIKPTTQTI